jgi:hypothetical protein
MLIAAVSPLLFRQFLAFRLATWRIVMPDISATRKRFDIALSFPGEHRRFVEAVAARLATVFGRERVLYDKYYEAEFARPNLDVYLPGLYRTQSELIVLFLCPEYTAKRWCNLEWRHIRNLLASVDEQRIMFLRYGYEGDFSDIGFLLGDGTINFEGRSAEDIADRIVERFKVNGGTLLGEEQPKKQPPSKAPAPLTDISRIDRFAPADLVGREAEMKLIDDAWVKAVVGEKHPRVLTFVALGGEGKTALVAKWAITMAERDWPDCDAAFAWSFYSEGTSERAAWSEEFLSEALQFFEVPAPEAPHAELIETGQDKGRRLAKNIGKKRALLILDGLEALQYPPTSPLAGQLKDEGVRSVLKSLAQGNRGLCVVTTRYAIKELERHSATAPQRGLVPLSRQSGGREGPCANPQSYWLLSPRCLWRRHPQARSC